MKRLIFLLLFASAVCAQTPVNISPVARQQFFSVTGVPLANGCVQTFAAGTSTPLATYSDAAGLFQNPNPILLDSGGFATIWLQQLSYRFVVFSAGGGNTCSTGIQQWAADNISATILNTANTWTQLQTFAGGLSVPLPLILTQGGFSNQLTASVTAARTWTIPDVSDTFVMVNATQTIANKTINNSTITSTSALNNVTMGSTAITMTLTNDSSIGTIVNNLATITGTASTAIIPNGGQTGGIVGICISGCGTTGSAQITTIGQASCFFDGAVTAGDYVIASPGTAGQCHDAGNGYPSGAQALGRATVTITAAGLGNMILFPTDIESSGNKIECSVTTLSQLQTRQRRQRFRLAPSPRMTSEWAALSRLSERDGSRQSAVADRLSPFKSSSIRRLLLTSLS
jgi:hypothetical protein